jgi:hypothetical protein
VTTATTMSRRRWKDLALRLTRGRGRGDEQAVTKSRDPSALTVTRSVANLGFEFMVCRSKNVLYNSVNPFSQLGNNCNIDNNTVGIEGYVVAPLSKYMWTYLAVDGIYT